MSQQGTTRPRRGLFIGRYFEIEFYLDYSWFIIAAILVHTLANDFPQFVEGRHDAVYLAMGLGGALMFFLSILLHELGHSLVSQRCGIPVPRITLMLIGGVAEISREPDDARSELKIALGGPAVSLVLVILYLSIAQFCQWRDWQPGAVVFSWLGWANAFLVIFNMIPGYPLDGGRVLRAVLWQRTGKLRRATYITSRIGILFSGLLIALGIYLLLALGQWNGIVLFIIALFLKRAAESGYNNSVEREVLAGLRVADLMKTPPLWVPTALPLSRAVDEFFLVHHVSALPACSDEGEFRAWLSLDAILAIPREKWPYTAVGDVANEGQDGAPIESIIMAEAQASRAMRTLMQGSGDGQLAVLNREGALVGTLSRGQMLEAIEVRSRLEE